MKVVHINIIVQPYLPKLLSHSSMVEHSAVNRVVVGSSPTRTVKEYRVYDQHITRPIHVYLVFSTILCEG